jgi:adenylate cyclase
MSPSQEGLNGGRTLPERMWNRPNGDQQPTKHGETTMNLVNRAPAVSIDLAHEPDFRLGALEIAPSTREVRSPRGSETVEPRVMQALVCLARADGAVVSRDDLIQSCWSGRSVSEDAINRCIAKIRLLSDGDEGGAFVIETIPRVGYRLASAASAPTDRREPEASREPSICVLPYANMSDDPQQEYFADGITEDIITDLHKVSSLFVVARNTAFTFKGRHVDVVQVSRQLGVSHVLEGSVRKVGNRVRITAQLVDGTTGGHVWAERFDRELKDIFALQDEISHAIVKALQLQLLPEEREVIGQRGTNDGFAYNLYLMARQTLAVCNSCNSRAAEAVVRICKRATEVDPDYAEAWALMAVGQSKVKSDQATGDGGFAAANRALALKPDLPEPHAVRARYYFEEQRFAESDAELETSLRLAPDSHQVNRIAGLLAYRSNRFEEAKFYWNKAFSLMETDLGSATMLTSTCHALGDVEGTRRAARMVLDRAEKDLAENPIDAAALGFSAYALAALGDAERAKERMDRSMLLEPENAHREYNFACALSKYLGETEEALKRLEGVMASMNRGFLDHIQVDPDLDPLRDDPRFQAMVRAVERRLEGVRQKAS